MNPDADKTTKHQVMLLSDSQSLTETIERSLSDDFGPLTICYNPEHWVDDFSAAAPKILVFAFEHIDLAIKCKALIETSLSTPSGRQYILLCEKKEVERAYTLCSQQAFNNYVVYWPISFDPPRLKMALVQAKIALEQDSQGSANTPSTTDSRLNALGNLLDQHFKSTNDQLSSVNQLLHRAEVDFDIGIEALYHHLQASKNPLGHSTASLDQNKLRDHFKLLLDGFDNIKDWSADFNKKATHHHQVASTLYTISNKKRSILIVDDDDFQRSVIRQMLKDEPYQLNFAKTGEEALEILARVSPNLILMDIMMPGIDGIEATRRISTHPQFHHIPVVMVTSHNERNVVVDCLKAGAVDFLVKPYNRNTLLEKIRLSIRAA